MYNSLVIRIKGAVSRKGGSEEGLVGARGDGGWESRYRIYDGLLACVAQKMLRPCVKIVTTYLCFT